MKQPFFGRLLFVVVALATLAVAYRLVATLALSPRTYDAAIDADLVPISSPLPGRLIELAVSDNQEVTAGDLLFRIDPENYRLELAQAEAELAVVEATLADQRRLREAERANATVAQDQVRRAQSNLDLARRTAERLTPMESQAYISRQTLDEALTAVRDTEISWQQALGAAQAAENQVQSTQALEAQVRANRAQVAREPGARPDRGTRPSHRQDRRAQERRRRLRAARLIPIFAHRHGHLVRHRPVPGDGPRRHAGGGPGGCLRHDR